MVTAGTLPRRAIARRAALRLVASYRREISSRTPARCASTPTCSEYAELAIARFGAVRGGVLAWRRYRACRAPEAVGG